MLSLVTMVLIMVHQSVSLPLSFSILSRCTMTLKRKTTDEEDAFPSPSSTVPPALLQLRVHNTRLLRHHERNLDGHHHHNSSNRLNSAHPQLRDRHAKKRL